MTESKAIDPSGSVMSWFRAPPNVYFGYNSTCEALSDLVDLRIKRVLILTDRTVSTLGYVKKIRERLQELGFDTECYADISSASSGTVASIQSVMRIFMPEAIVAIGGGTVMDMAKISRFTYDPSKPIKTLHELYAYDHKQLFVSNPCPCDRYVKRLVCIPTTSGTGSEMTPIAWVQDDSAKTETNRLPLKRPIVSFQMTPEMVVNDAFFVQKLPKDVVVAGGLNALVAAVESLGSRLASDYTRAFSIQAAKLIFHNLKASTGGVQNAREACHRAASIAGLATANAFVGIGYAIGFVLSNFIEYKRGKKLPQGLSSSLVLSEVIRYNSRKSPATAQLYARLANETLGHPMEADLPAGSKALDVAVERLVNTVKQLRMDVGENFSLKDYMSLSELDSSVDSIASDAMKVVGCSDTNAVPVTAEDVKAIVRAAYS